MLRIEGTSIYLTRGDTAYLKITPRNKDGSEYELQEGDKIIFRLKRAVNDTFLIVEKEVDTSSLILTLLPEDTEPCGNGRDYLWEAELQTAAGQHYTFIANARFHIGVELEVRNE